MSETLPLLIILPLSFAVILNLLHGRNNLLKNTVLGFCIALLLIPMLTPYGNHIFSGHEKIRYGGDLNPGIEYIFGGNQQILIFILALIAYLVITSYIGLYKNLSGPYLGFIMLGVSATTAVLCANDLFNFYVFMEIALISQTALAISSSTLESIKASLKYLIVANLVGNLFLLGIAFILSLTGSVNISDIKSQLFTNGVLLNHPIMLAAAGLIVFTWLYIGGMFPFHNMKSELYSSAPAHASAIMQTQSKFLQIALGIIILKLFGQITNIKIVMLVFGAFAMILGVLMALKQDNYQKMLSYHAISQAGYVALGLAIGTPLAITAAIFHAINNALYKSALFLGADAIKQRQGTLKFSNLGGMISVIPAIAVLMFFAKLAISGVPLFNGFQSKYMLAYAAFDSGMPELSLLMILVSVLTFISMMKAFYVTFLRPGEYCEQNVDSRADMKTVGLTMTVLIGLCIILGIFPSVITSFIEPLAAFIGGDW